MRKGYLFCQKWYIKEKRSGWASGQTFPVYDFQLVTYPQGLFTYLKAVTMYKRLGHKRASHVNILNLLWCHVLTLNKILKIQTF